MGLAVYSLFWTNPCNPQLFTLQRNKLARSHKNKISERRAAPHTHLSPQAPRRTRFREQGATSVHVTMDTQLLLQRCLPITHLFIHFSTQRDTGVHSNCPDAMPAPNPSCSLTPLGCCWGLLSLNSLPCGVRLFLARTP